MKKPILVLIAVLLTTSMASAGEILEYRETMAGEISTFKVDVYEKTDEVIKIRATSTQGEEIYSELNGRDGSTLRWTKVHKGTLVSAVRKGQTIELVSNKDGKVKIHPIDQAPWIQSREYGMRGFMRNSGEKKREFWLLTPGELNLNRMIATKEEQKRIKVGGKEFEAVKVVVRVAGWKQHFWSSEFWFRVSDGVFLKYKGSASGPNSPQVISELVREEKDSSEAGLDLVAKAMGRTD